MAAGIVRQKRQSAPKVKTGCQTCRIRRVKCGEERPACKKCSGTGRICDGYSSDSLGFKERSPSLPLIQRVSTHIPGTTAEKRGFHYFLTNTATELSGYYSPVFWEGLILQAASGEPSLRHAIIAIGSLHEDFSSRRLAYSEEEDSGFAITQYTKAIGCLRKALSNGKHNPLTALLSCILFVTFDSIRGSFATAIVHLQSGLRILRDLRNRPTKDAFLIDEMLAPLFVRLSLQAILYVESRSTPIQLVLVPETMIPGSHNKVMPSVFNTLEECRNSIHAAAYGMFRVFHQYDSEKPAPTQLAYSLELRQKWKQEIEDSAQSFDRFMNAKSKTLSSREIQGAALLKIQQIIVKIMSEMIPPDLDNPGEKLSSDVFLPYTNDFLTVVNLSRSLITASEQDARAGRPMLTFSADTCLIAPLWYASTHCQNKSIRNAALEQLNRCPRREGMWDGDAMSRIIRSYWIIQENHHKQQKINEAMNLAKVPLAAVVDIELNDGMKWTWKWKNVASSYDNPVRWCDDFEDGCSTGGFQPITTGIDGI